VATGKKAHVVQVAAASSSALRSMERTSHLQQMRQTMYAKQIHSHSFHNVSGRRYQTALVSSSRPSTTTISNDVTSLHNLHRSGITPRGAKNKPAKQRGFPVHRWQQEQYHYQQFQPHNSQQYPKNSCSFPQKILNHSGEGNHGKGVGKLGAGLEQRTTTKVNTNQNMKQLVVNKTTRKHVMVNHTTLQKHNKRQKNGEWTSIVKNHAEQPSKSTVCGQNVVLSTVATTPATTKMANNKTNQKVCVARSVVIASHVVPSQSSKMAATSFAQMSQKDTASPMRHTLPMSPGSTGAVIEKPE
jgi:hypothetical protein